MRRMRVAVVTAGLALGLSGFLLARTGPPQTSAAATAPTFTKDVAPILYKNCTSCHREGEIGPMPLVTYEHARPYAKAMRDEVSGGHMPPWDADPRYGKFLNDRRLSDADKQTIVRWADAGAPRGDEKDMPPLPSYITGWSIGTPDAVFTMPTPYEVPAKGTIEYQYFEIPTSFTEDKWVQALEIRPGARSVVHHVLVYAREPAGAGPARPAVLRQRADLGIPVTALTRRPPEAPPIVPRRLGTLIGTTAPGTNATIFRPGTAMQIRAGAVLTLQMHYTASGETTSDRTSVGFVFAKEPPAEEIRASQFVNGRFVIPAGAGNHQVDSEVGFNEDVKVWGLFPHTHLRGKRWEYRLVHPDGRSEIILSVPAYDFNWQTYYMFEQPLAVARGSKIEASAWYDNSPSNRSNPDPKMDVRWGDQTWEEMQYTGIMYSVDSQRRNGGGR